MLYQTFAQHLLHKSASAPFNTEKIKHNTMQNRQIKNKGIKITLAHLMGGNFFRVYILAINDS